MKVAARQIVTVAAVLGISSGCAWFILGDRLEGQVGWFSAWFVCPAVVPLAFAFCLLLVDASAATASRTTESVLFFTVYYAMHWLPMGVLMWLVFFMGLRLG